MAVAWDPLADGNDNLELTDASDFTSMGAVRLTANNEDSWFLFASRTGNVLRSLRPVFDKKSPYTQIQATGVFPIGTVASQMYDLSNFVDDWELEQHEGDGEAYWTLNIRGTGWNSLQVYQDAQILAVADHYDSILGAHDPHILFAGFLGEPSVTGDPSKNTWQASAEGLRKYLLLQRNTPRQVGGQLVKGAWTASEALGDVGAEPMEGINPADFAIANVDDDDIATPYVSKDVPTVTTLVDGPTGGVQPDTQGKPYAMLPYTGQGLRIHMAYLNPVPSGIHSAQDQKFIVLYNNHQLEPPDKGADTVSVLEWGKIDITQYSLWTQNADQNRPLGLYLGSKNGGPAPPMVLMPHQGAVLCYDEPTLRAQWSVPPGWQVYELKQCAGELFGLDPNVDSRGMGLAWDPDPDGCWIALRGGGRAGNYTDSLYSGQVVSEDTGAGTVTLHETGWTDGQMTARMATFPVSGYVRGESSDVWKAYTGVDSANRKLTGVTHVKGNPLFAPIEVIGGENPGPGERINVSEFSSYWTDFVAIGENIISKIPRQFPVRRAVSGSDYTPRDADGNQTGPSTDVGDGAMQDQNDMRPGEHVWGLWDNGGALTVVYDTDGMGSYETFFRPGSAGWNAAPAAWKVAPACPRLQAIRRSVMGGGNFQEFAVANDGWKDHDSNSRADWAIQAGPRLGNLGELDSYIWLEFQAEELDRAVVVVDNSDVGDANGTITVTDYQARDYPGASPRDGRAWYMRALLPGGSAVDFLYSGREDSRFTGVTKLPGFAGIAITAGSELVTMVNSRTSWNKAGANAYVQRNMPRAIGLSWAHWRADPPETVVTAVTANTVTVLPGTAAPYPTSGEIRFTRPPSDGIIITAADFQGSPGTNANGYTNYSGRTDDTFTGITWATGQPEVGWILSGGDGQGASFPDDMDVLLTREPYPTSPVTFLNRNESWDVAYTLGNHGVDTARPNAAMVEKYFPFSGQDSPFFWKLFAKVHRMSNAGRVAASRLRVHKMPYRVTSPGGTSVDGHEWRMSYLTSTLAHDILVEAGVDPATMVFRGGSDVFSLDLADGSPWGEARGLARISGCILMETADGRRLFHEHPQAPGAHYGMGPKLTLDGDALWGPVRATERPRHAVGQVILEARNAVTDMSWTIEEPNDAMTLGEIRRLPAQIVQSEEAGHAIARLALRQANGGWELDAPGGPPFVILEYGDVLRLVNVTDEAGRFHNGEYAVAGIRHSGGRSRMRSTVKLREWQVV